MQQAKPFLIAVGVALLAASPATAQPSDRAEIATALDREWVSVSGVVKSSRNDNFVLDYGAGQITVELDDYDAIRENMVVAGDRVTVTGQTDDDFYDKRTIEASTVYVDKLHTYFYANPADEEGGYYNPPTSSLATDEEWVAMTGTVVRKQGDELTLDTGTRNLTVDISEVPYDVFADAGDRITVYGEMDDADLFEGRELLATSVVIQKQAGE
ncbi:NirD/YgiW/YdeI family stress tolerance protein [Desertibaculum subflavum]|uniref:NirD/YgiW/YdeI family stress tolerance protein n=1 Tax=Desertibaculum subflavum TaxID=2268458 RepID=UPI0013C4793E